MTEEIKQRINEDLEHIISEYNAKMSELYDETNGGTIRGKKGTLVEDLAKKLVRLTWDKVLQQDPNRLKPEKDKLAIPIKMPSEYVLRNDIDVLEKDRILENSQNIKYDFSTDIHVRVDDNPVIAIECKAYAETAMLKRTIFDSMLLDEAFPQASHCLFQLEAASASDQQHVLMSHHTHNIDILTLLEGKRDSKKPIHKREYAKELKKEKLLIAIEYFESKLRSQI